MVKIITMSTFTAAAMFLIFFSFLQSDCLQATLKKEHSKNPAPDNLIYIGLIFIIGLIARFIMAAKFHGHSTDMNCFSAWAGMLFSDGIPAFYASESFTDYPPGYMYILYVIGALKSFLPLSGGAADALVKSPAIICDVITAMFVYKIGKKHLPEYAALIISAFYMFNPAVILNSSLWGQVDSVFTLFLLIMVYLITEKKLIPAYYVFAAAIFIKPQALIFTPVPIYGIIDNVFLPKFNKKMFVKNLLWGLGAIAFMFILAIPFGVNHVIKQYISTLASYPYASVNAFNIWAAFGQNWAEITGFTSFIGGLFIVLIVLATAVLSFKSKDSSKYYFIAALLSFGTFMLSTKMHERYDFPAMVMLLCAFIVLPNTHIMNSYIFMVVSQFINAAWVLFIYETDTGKYFRSTPVNVFSLINIALLVYIIYVAVKIYVNGHTTYVETIRKQVNEKANNPQPKNIVNTKPSLFENTKQLAKITKFDIIAMVIITAVYSAIALYDLGDNTAPQTHTELVKDQSITFDLGEVKKVSQLQYFLGVTENREFELSYSVNADGKDGSKDIKMVSVFAWGKESINADARYITLKCNSDGAMLKELAIIDENGEKIQPVNSADYPELFDEQEIVPERFSFRNSTYFDEIYHARTAYEFVHSLNPYEWTHPPLGKVFISLGIQLFGMTPFGWRIVGTVFGIFMVPVIYFLAKKITKHTWLAIVTCLLFTFDFMHFAQTRIATIDVYVTFFIMLMYYFMYKYYCTSFYDTKFSKTLIPLGLSGLFMGFGIASKWTGVYAGCGLAVLFFITLYKRYREYTFAKINPRGESNGISHAFVIKNFKNYTIKTIIFCVIMFIAVPLTIYGLSYIPYLKADGMQGIKSIIDNQSAMLTYHGKTVVNSTHSFSSHWYEWPIMKRPIWYYSGEVSSTVKEGISSFGNPAVWWTSIIAFFYMVYLSFKNKDRTAIFLVISYLAQLVSWIPVTRITFIYHYFPSVPFLVLMIGYSIYTMYTKNKKVMYYAFAYTAVAIILFVMFYPILSGQPVEVDYVKNYLRWFESWVLISG